MQLVSPNMHFSHGSCSLVSVSLVSACWSKGLPPSLPCPGSYKYSFCSMRLLNHPQTFCLSFVDLVPLRSATSITICCDQEEGRGGVLPRDLVSLWFRLLIHPAPCSSPPLHGRASLHYPSHSAGNAIQLPSYYPPTRFVHHRISSSPHLWLS
jgi:hypothetical protein